MAMEEFDASELLKLTVREMAAALGGYTVAQLQAAHAAELAKGAEARKGALQALRAEIDGRPPELSDESIDLIAFAAHRIASADIENEIEWAAMSAEDRANVVIGVLAVLTAPEQDTGEVFVRAVLALAPLFVQLEALAAQLDGAPAREHVGPGSAVEEKPADTRAARARLLAKAAELAFCEGDGVAFKLPVTAGDFDPSSQKLTYLNPVVLRRDKPQVRIDQVVLLDGDGKPLARVRWAVPLEGGAGREALFPARCISFDLV
jgi:hypothetical protein